MIEYINKRMNEWSIWCKRREDGGMGYPSKSNYCNPVQIHGSGGAGPVTEASAAMEIESIVIKIRKARPAQYDVAFWFYLAGSMTVKRIAQELRCSEVTVYNRLHALHLAVMDGLHDLEIEAQDRADEERARANDMQRGRQKINA
jgi:hypothetical protein